MENDPEISTEWPKRKEKKVKKETLIKLAKVRGEEHRNHKGKLITARATGEPCR